MSGFKREESKFTPVPDGIYTMYASEATFTISSNKGTPGVNFKFKVNDMDEAGNPQPQAGRTFFTTMYLTDKTTGDFCAILDAMGFKIDGEGYYVMPDGSRMADFFKMAHQETISFLVGLPFIGKLTGKDEEYENKEGVTIPKTSYRVRPNFVIPEGGGKKVLQLSRHPSKAAMYAPAMAGSVASPNAAGIAAAAAAAFTNQRAF